MNVMRMEDVNMQMEKLDNNDNEPWFSRNRFKILLIKYLSGENKIRYGRCT